MAKDEKTEKLYQLKRGAEVREKTEDGWSSKISLIRKGKRRQDHMYSICR